MKNMHQHINVLLCRQEASTKHKLIEYFFFFFQILCIYNIYTIYYTNTTHQPTCKPEQKYSKNEIFDGLETGQVFKWTILNNCYKLQTCIIFFRMKLYI